jgi:two-component system OmpR family response regulator
MLGRYLMQQGFAVSLAGDSAEALHNLESEAIDLILLDIMMPGEDGLSLCRSLADRPHPPIILVTARMHESDRLRGFEAGADDYVVKPFSPAELVGRIRAVLRRSRSMPYRSGATRPLIYRFADRSLDASTGRLKWDGQDDVVLSTAELNVLRMLLDQPRVVLSRDVLMETARGRSHTPFDRSIDNVISRLRRKIEEPNSERPLIRTVWGEGYVLTVDVWRGFA